MRHPHRNILVALAGQPNCGKSTVFNMITGARQHVANFPGVTVEKKAGAYRVGESRVDVVDLPGTYSLTSFSQEERIARDFILLERPEVVVVIADGSNLARHLFLFLQLQEMGVPLVLCVNMMDVAARRGLTVDAERLARELGVAVVPTIARRGVGREELRDAIWQTAQRADHVFRSGRIDYGEELEPVLGRLEEALEAREHLMEDFSARWLAVKVMEGDDEARRIVEHHTHDETAPELIDLIDRERAEFQAAQEEPAERLIAQARYRLADRLADACVRKGPGGRVTLTDRVDRFVCHPVLGLLVVATALYLSFTLTFRLSDTWAWIPWPQGWTTPTGAVGWLFDEKLPGLLGGMPEGPLRSLVEDGVIGGVGGVMSFVPIIFFMFVFLAILEDSGFIARIAFLLDRALRHFGLPGNAVLPLIISGGIAGGCAVPGVLATRTLQDERDRLTTMLVAPFMNCGAKIPVYAMLIAAFFAEHEAAILLVMAALSWSVALGAASLLRRTVVRGEQAVFVLELPRYHLPTLGGVLRNAGGRAWLYLRKAGTLILVVNILLWALMYFPRPSAERFREARAEARASLESSAADVAHGELLRGEGLSATRRVTGLLRDAARREDPHALQELAREDPHRYALVTRALDRSEAAEAPVAVVPEAADLDVDAAAVAYAEYLSALERIERERAAVQLRGSLAGRLGRLVEPVSRICGFDWRDNIALIGGVAAKEVIISAMGTAYSLGEVEPPEDAPAASKNPLARRLQADPDWTPLRAFALMVFVMAYAPCFATLLVLWREAGSWKWAVFALLYSTSIAFVLAAIVYQGGQLLGLGV